ncbi:MarR family transcriptional regulator [Hyphomonas johnsonii MHS-2]|uniref:MarR family transcriptional regulator n=2 Tax=Hyphomonas johnsonii TaxID=81031 RepID=A0A059FQS9_9PROT|nr:MarR family transcriptional regulator [Hyphomonas johnsonii MHS-2]
MYIWEHAMPDILQDLGYLALGSRLKRLAERLQADATQVFEQNCFVTQPSHFPLLAALDRYGPLTVGEAVAALGVSQPAVTRSLLGLIDLGLAETTVSETDRRQKSISLTPDGIAAIARMKRDVWPHVARAAEELAAGPDAGLLDQLARVEAALDERSLSERARDGHAIVDYSDDLADAFYTINAEWITEMFSLEPEDRHVLSHPREAIIDKGGAILFVSTGGLGIVGTCALMPVADGTFELTKMGVLKTARGRKAGEYLLAATLDRARSMDMETLFLLTSRKCESAIHLYEKLGFRHDAGILATFGKRYERCNVAMTYPLDQPAQDIAAPAGPIA